MSDVKAPKVSKTPRAKKTSPAPSEIPATAETPDAAVDVPAAALSPESLPETDAGTLAAATDEPSSESPREEEPTDSAPPLPSDIAAWRAFFAAVPPRDIWKVIQKERFLSARVFAGFRAAPETLRNPVVLQRLADEAQKHPKFAQLVGSIFPPAASPPAAASAPEAATDSPADESVPAANSTLPANNGTVRDTLQSQSEKDDSRLKDKVKEQRTALRDRDVRISELEAALMAAHKDRDGAKAETAAEHAARKAAEAEAERQKRQRERDVRREEAKATEAAARAEKPRRTAAAPAAATLPSSGSPTQWEEALRRLLTRERFGVVAEICREAISGGNGEAPMGSGGARGRVHALYAASLYGLGTVAAAEEQDRIASNVLLDAGDIPAAAECLARILIFVPTPRAADAPLARRLFLLAEKLDQAETVREIFTRMRIGSPDAYRRLRALGAEPGGGGRKSSALVDRLAPLETASGIDGAAVGRDETVALPSVSGVTARRIVEAVDSGEVDWIRQVQAGLEDLRMRGGPDAAAADSLLETVATLDPVAVQPLLRGSTRSIIVDASNVARHNADPLSMARAPRVAYLRQMRDMLLRRGYFPVHLIADANLRFHMDDRNAYEDMLRRHIVRETPPGRSADETLIRESQETGAPLVTNDRLSEWGDAAFSIERYGFVIQAGGITLTNF